MKISRRAFNAALLLSGASIGGLVSSGIWTGKDVVIPRSARGKESALPPKEPAINRRTVRGYPVRYAIGGTAPGWSAAPGDTIHFALSSDRSINPDLWLANAAGDKVHSFGPTRIEPQSFGSNKPWFDGAGHISTTSWAIPPNTLSGVYFLNGLPDIFVVVRAANVRRPNPQLPDSIPTAVLVPTNTINAYATTRGRSLYNHPTRVPTVSFLRPFNSSLRQKWIGLIKWIVNEPIFKNAQYLTDHDLENGDALEGIRLLIIDGHSEYWSRQARQVFDRFVNSGGNVIAAGGNLMWWQIRYERNGEQLTAYKKYEEDPVPDPLLKTINWSEPTLGMAIDQSLGGDFIRGGFGRKREGAGVNGPDLRFVDPEHPLLSAIGAEACDVIDLGGVTEYDGAPIKGLDQFGKPVADLVTLGAHRLEILASGWGLRGGEYTLGTVHVYQRTKSSGVILHLGTKECCNSDTAGSVVMRQICHEFARRTLKSEPLFSGKPLAHVAFPMHTPWDGDLHAIPGACGTPIRNSKQDQTN